MKIKMLIFCLGLIVTLSSGANGDPSIRISDNNKEDTGSFNLVQALESKFSDAESTIGFELTGPVGTRFGCVSPTQYGAVGDGVHDDTHAIEKAIANAFETGCVEFPKGRFRYTKTIALLGQLAVYGQGSGSSILQPDASVTRAIEIGGGNDDWFLGFIIGIGIERVTYTPESIGWAFRNAIESNFYHLKSNNSERNFAFLSGIDERVAYCNYFGLTGARGRINISWEPTGNGYANENNFFGGRLFAGPQTETHVHWNGGSGNRFYGVSAEGSAQQAFYLGGTSNLIHYPRVEGEWAVRAIVVDAGAIRNSVDGFDFYTRILDRGLATRYVTHNDGSKYPGTLNGIIPMTVGYYGRSNGDTLRLENSHKNGVSKLITAYGSATLDDVPQLVASLSSAGGLEVARSVAIDQSEWDARPLRLGDFFIWIDAGGDLRIKKGAPNSDVDGKLVGE